MNNNDNYYIAMPPHLQEVNEENSFNNSSFFAERNSHKVLSVLKHKSLIVRQVFNYMLQMNFNKKRLILIFGLKPTFDEMVDTKEQILNAMIDLYYASELDHGLDIDSDEEEDIE